MLEAYKKGGPPGRDAPEFDLEEPEGGEKRGFVSSYGAGLRHHRDIPPESKRESDQNTGQGKHQHSSPH